MSLDLSLGVGDGAASLSGRVERWRTTASAPAAEATAPVGKSLAPVRFADADTKERVCRDAALGRSIVLRPRADAPGGLASGIDGDLESALALRGAVPSALGDSASLEERLRDQISRALCVPVKGVCLALPPLGACVDVDGVLADLDARYLGAWLRAATARPLPIAILFDERDRGLLARVPRSLEDVLADLRGETRGTPSKPLVPQAFASAVTLTDDVEETSGTKHEQALDGVAEVLLAADESMSIPDLIRLEGASPSPSPTEVVIASETSSTDAVRETSAAEAPQVIDVVVSAVVAVADVERAVDAARIADAEESPKVVQAAVRDVAPARPEPTLFARTRRAPEQRVHVTALTEADVTHAREETARRAHAPKSLATAMAETLKPAPAPPAPDATTKETSAQQLGRVITTAEWRTHAVELDAARGPKPVAAIERLFAQRYLPLLGALARHEADHAVGSIVEQWSQAFAESYTDAYSALKVTGRRPTMVLDAFDVASRIARLSSARTVKLVLIDSMSFDLAERVALRMKTILDKRAVLVERTTLWSALPTTTPTQMNLLARGPDGLRESAPPSSNEPDIARGRNISSLRRERVGPRELMKLDLVEARLRGPGGEYDERLDAIADEVTEIVVKFMETLPPRTLLYVFGDHGFVLGHGSNGWATGPATQGGTTPEEVLVAGHAWLVDAMQ